MISTLLENTKALLIFLFHLVTLWPWSMIKAFLPKKQKDISGEIMFITGAGSGIGRLMAIKFASLGATMICTDINKESCDETAEMIKKDDGKVYSFKLDVTDRHKVYELADQIRAEIGDVTMLINNAGIVTGKHFMECPDELMIKTMEVNTISHFWTLKAFLGSMLKKNHGHIVTVASLAGHIGSPRLIDYTASKFGAVGLHEALALELTATGNNIKTTSICPFFIKTGMFAGTKSMSPITLPLLEPDDCVNQIVSGVLNDDAIVFVPPRSLALVAFKNLVPMNLAVKACNYLKLHDQMSGFKGRQKSE